MMLVSLQQARDHVRSDTMADDADLTLKIHGASGAVLAYLEDAAEAFLDTAGFVPMDSNGDPLGVPYEVKAATLLLIGDFYSNRGEDQSTNWTDPNYLPRAVTALLYPKRKPALR
jgi:hypothetical protein